MTHGRVNRRTCASGQIRQHQPPEARERRCLTAGSANIMERLTEERRMPDVLCIGNIQFDVLARPLVALPRPGTLARVEEIRFSLGGNGMNTAAGLAQLGIPTALFGMVSRDFMGD